MSRTSATQHDRRLLYAAVGFLALTFFWLMSTIAIEIVSGHGLAWYWGPIGVVAAFPAIYLLGSILEVILSD